MSTGVQSRHDYRAVVAAMRQELDVLDRYLAAFTLERWRGPTACPEWSVQKLVSHLSSGAEIHLRTLRANLDGAPPLAGEDRQPIWDYFDGLEPAPLHGEFRDRTRAYLEYLERLPEPKRADGRVESFAGHTPVVEYAQYRLSELTQHSWDIRITLDPTARLLPGSTAAHFPHALDTLTRRSNAEVRAALDGLVYRFEVFGPVRQEFSIAIHPDAVELLDEPSQPPAATLRLPSEAFLRLYVGRLLLEQAEAEGEVAISGDRATALRLNELFPGF